MNHAFEIADALHAERVPSHLKDKTLHQARLYTLGYIERLARDDTALSDAQKMAAIAGVMRDLRAREYEE